MDKFLTLRRHTPVAVLAAVDETIATLVLRLHVLQPAFDVGVILAQRSIVAIMTDEHLE